MPNLKPKGRQNLTGNFEAEQNGAKKRKGLKSKQLKTKKDMIKPITKPPLSKPPLSKLPAVQLSNPQKTKPRPSSPTNYLQADVDLEQRIKQCILRAHSRKRQNFTAVGSHDIEERIQSDMMFIRQFVMENCPYHKNITLVLGGSYGAGEGGVYIERRVEKTFNDYDFFVFGKPMNYAKIRRINRFFKDVSPLLSKRMGIKVDFSRLINYEQAENFPAALRWYDLQRGNRILLGQYDLISYGRQIRNTEIPIQEALQLLLNRGIGMLGVKDKMAKQKFVRLTMEKELNKITLALGDALLIARGCYSRHNKLELMSLCGENSDVIKELYPLYEKAFNFHRAPQETLNQESIVALFESISYHFSKIYLELFSLYYNKQISYFSQLALLLYDKPVVDYRSSSQFKNIFLNASYFGTSTLFNKWGYSHPVNRLYATLPFFLFKTEETKFLVKFIDAALDYNPPFYQKSEEKQKGKNSSIDFFNSPRTKHLLRIWSRFN